MLKSIKINLKFSHKFIRLFLIGILLFLYISPVLSQNINDGINLVEESRINYKEKNYFQSAENLEKAIKIFEQKNDQEKLAISYVNLGTLQLLLGQNNNAYLTWQKATNIYKELNNDLEVSNSLILQAKALNKLNLYPSACNTLILALRINSTQNKIDCQQIEFTPTFIDEINANFINKNQSNYLEGLMILGNTLRNLGRLDDSQIILSKILDFIPNNNKALFSATYLSLGDTLTAMGNLETERQLPPKNDYLPWLYQPVKIPPEAKNFYINAETMYQQAINFALSQDQNTLVKAQLKLLSLLLKLDDVNQTQQFFSNIKTNLDKLAFTDSKIYAQINYAKNWAYLLQKEANYSHQDIVNNDQLYQPIINLLNEVINEAKILNNNQTLSYAFGNLGGLYEYLGDFKNAQKYTEEALYLAQPSENPILAYQWQWQLARLFEAQNNQEKAMISYENAVKSLQSIRDDLLTVNTDVQFSFRDNVEPLYRNLVNLLLSSNNNNPSQENIWKSIYYIDALQLAELENFLQCNVQPKIATTEIYQKLNVNKLTNILQQQIATFLEKNSHTAFIYTFTFKDRVSVILKLANQDLIYHSANTNSKSLQNIITEASKSLKLELYEKGSEKPLHELYKLLLSNIDNNLQENQVKTLVFVLDNNLRQIPMSALYNGNEFIVNKYAVTVVPTGQILQTQNYQPEKFEALLAGSTKQRPNFDSLELAFQQIELIKPFFSSEKVLIEKSGQPFTKNSFENTINSSNYNLVHLVTHGKFSSNPKETYLITDDNSNNFDEYSIKINEFNNYLNKRNKPVDLLVLSACETAKGDKRAVLGIAGVAVKSGANATIAPLWTADQEKAGIFMQTFYDNLTNKKVSKAEALQLTQKSFLAENNPEFQSPRHWALWALVGY